MVPDELVGNLGDVHLYSNHIEQAKEQITREPMKLPTLKIMDYDSGLSITRNQEHWEPIDFVIKNYESHPTIKAPLSN
jgi:thymidylate synthase